MAAPGKSKRSLSIKKNYTKSPYPAILNKLRGNRKGSLKDTILYLCNTVIRIAKNSMEKAPKSPKSRFGNMQAYRSGSAKVQQGKFYFWRKGAYSRPGTPPFWHDRPGNRKGKRSKASLKTMAIQRNGRLSYQVGPVHLPQRSKPTVPALHEYGGTVTMRAKSYFDPISKKRIKRQHGMRAYYPKRPYMLPAYVKAVNQRKKGSFYDRFISLGGMEARKVNI